jgi:hypothetical protein
MYDAAAAAPATAQLFNAQANAPASPRRMNSRISTAPSVVVGSPPPAARGNRVTVAAEQSSSAGDAQSPLQSADHASSQLRCEPRQTDGVERHAPRAQRAAGARVRLQEARLGLLGQRSACLRAADGPASGGAAAARRAQLTQPACAGAVRLWRRKAREQRLRHSGEAITSHTSGRAVTAAVTQHSGEANGPIRWSENQRGGGSWSIVEGGGGRVPL